MGFFSSSHTSSSFQVWKCILLLKQSQWSDFFLLFAYHTLIPDSTGVNSQQQFPFWRRWFRPKHITKIRFQTQWRNGHTHKKKIFRGNIWIDPQPCTSGSVLLIFEMESKAEKPFRKISNPTTTATIPDGQCPIKIDVSAMLFAFWMFGGKRKNNSRF